MFGVILLISLLCVPYAIAQKYVSSTASGSGDGSIGNPWTVAQANSNAVAGDVIYFRTGVYDAGDGYIIPANSGTSGSWLTFSAYPGERVVFTATAYLANLVDVDYISIEGFYTTGPTSGWVYIGKSGGGHYKMVRDTLYNPLVGTAVSTGGDVASFQYLYCWADRADSVDGKVSPGSGDIITNYSYPGGYYMSNVLIKGSYFRRSYHSAINFKSWYDPSSNIIIDSCLFEQNRHPLDGNGLTNVLIQRNRVTYKGDIPSNSDQDNILQFVDDNIDQVIYRGNLAWADSATVDVADWENGEGMFGLSLNGSTNDLVMKNIYIYHNTIDWWCPTRNAMATGMQFSADYHAGITGDSVDHIRTKNNIVIGVKTTYGAGESVVWQRDLDRTYASLDHIFQYNIFNKDTGSTMVKMTTSAGTSYATLSELESSFPTKWSANTWTKPASWSHTNPTYVLAATDIGVDDAGALTTTINSGSNSQSMTMADVRYFTDGMGLILGDTIYVSGMTPSTWVTITAIDYAADTVHLGQARTWSNGTDVYWYRDGEQANDIGANQLVSGAEPPPATTGIRRAVPVRR